MTTRPVTLRPRGRPALVLPLPLCILERQITAVDRHGQPHTRRMYAPALWLPGVMLQPLTFPAGLHAPRYSRGPSRFTVPISERLFTRRAHAARWLLSVAPTGGAL